MSMKPEINSLNITTEGLRVDVTNIEETIVTLQQSDQEQEVELSTLDDKSHSTGIT